MVSFTVRKLLCLMQTHWIIFAFLAIDFGVRSKKLLPGVLSRSLLSTLSSVIFMCCHLILESLIHFELILCTVSSSGPVSCVQIVYKIYKKDLNDPCNHDSVITHLEPDILEYKAKWALGSITMNKASGGDRTPGELFQILKDDAVEKCCTQYASKLENSAVATRLEKVNFHSNTKERQCQRMLKLPHNCTHLTS